MALTDDALDCSDSALSIVDLPEVPPEVEFLAVFVKVLLGNVVVYAMDASLPDGEVGLYRIGVGVATDILFLAVVHYLMSTVKFLPDAPICRPLVGHDARVLVYIRPYCTP